MANDEALPDPARVVIRRRIEWIDTDAAGIYHWTTVFRLAETAEATFSRSVRFNDRVEVELVVEAIGRTSLTYRLAIASEGEPVAEGTLTVVFIDRATRRATPWPKSIRERLASAGLVEEPVL
jgi:acyl-CoA thioesterase FadM